MFLDTYYVTPAQNLYATSGYILYLYYTLYL
jgi:hypothetical protein